MRILQVHNHHGSLGGAMEVLQHEADLLRNAGHPVHTYTLAPAEELGLSPLRAGAKAIWNTDASHEVGALIRSFRPDVMHVHTPFPLVSPAVFRTAKKLGVATVTTLHSYRYSCIAATCFRDGHICEDCVGKRVKLPGVAHRCYHESMGASAALTISLALHRAIGTLHDRVDRYLALTEFAKDLLVRDGVPVDRVTVKPNSVPDPGVSLDPPPAEGRYVAFVGRLMDIKGVTTMLEAWRLSDHQDLRLRIVGDGESRAEVEEAALRDPSISFEGWVGEDAVFDLMRGAEAVLVPSEWYEGGCPLVTLRSLAVGTPVVISDLANISDFVKRDESGVAFRPGDATDFARVLSDVAADRVGWTARRPIARASYDKRYSPTVNITRLEQIYSEVSRG